MRPLPVKAVCATDVVRPPQTAQSAISIPADADVASDPFLDEYEVEDARQTEDNVRSFEAHMHTSPTDRSPQELLRAFITARSRSGLSQGLVIQSEEPEKYPSIVITPPPYAVCELYCPCGHCDYDTPSLPPQSSDHLKVPPRHDEGILKAAYPWQDGEMECPPVHREAPSEYSSDDDTDLFGQPCRVFSPSLFSQTVGDRLA